MAKKNKEIVTKFNFLVDSEVCEKNLCSATSSGKKQHLLIPYNSEAIPNSESVKVLLGCRRCNYRIWQIVSKEHFQFVKDYMERDEK